MNLTKTTTLSAASVACLGLSAAVNAGSVEPLTTIRVASGMNRPIYATHAPDDYQRLYILEKRGVIQILDLRTNTLNASPFLDIDSIVVGGSSNNDEQGLLGLEFHPEFRTNGYFFVNYTGSGGVTHIDRYTAKFIDGVPSPDLADPQTRTDLISIVQPFANHNGGWIGFSPTDVAAGNNYLYICTGDGGSGGDPGNRAQDITDQFLGKLLRVDVDGTDEGNYGIPPSNPFVGLEGDDEIWAYGVRNPWQSTFDRETGDLYIADVGQNAWEELDVQPASSMGGENYGWRCREGNANYNFSGDCAKQTLVPPIYAYSHGGGDTQGFSVSGGAVYRGCAIPSFRGHYLFADYVNQRLWSLLWDGGSGYTDFVTRTNELSPSQDGQIINQITSIGEDARGEVYIVDQGGTSTGQIFKLIPVTPTIAPEDIDCDGMVGFSDLLRILSAWGPCFGCPEDLDGSGAADFADVLRVLAEWG